MRLPAVRHGAATQQPWAPPSPTSSKPSPSPAPSAINYSLDLRRGVPLARRLPGATPRGVTPPRRRCSSADLPGRQRSSSHRPPCSLGLPFCLCSSCSLSIHQVLREMPMR
ncbi:hypothetical protein U9M48_018696 [Paspalum notatum var. saurae]|uniref:Uncharacterized protein n=1 Tax=Paspalum notatum var. saurae TaxID=547442 RepID=A0AAQ3WQ21_PASNO